MSQTEAPLDLGVEASIDQECSSGKSRKGPLAQSLQEATTCQCVHSELYRADSAMPEAARKELVSIGSISRGSKALQIAKPVSQQAGWIQQPAGSEQMLAKLRLSHSDALQSHHLQSFQPAHR